MSPNFVLLGLSLLHDSSASRGDAEIPESRRRALLVYVYLENRKQAGNVSLVKYADCADISTFTEAAVGEEETGDGITPVGCREQLSNIERNSEALISLL